MAITHSRIELRIAGKLIDTILAAGYSISVYEGEDFALAEPSRHKPDIMEALASTDMDTIRFHDAEGKKQGWFLLIYGNEEDLVSDSTDNEATQMIDQRFQSALLS